MRLPRLLVVLGLLLIGLVSASQTAFEPGPSSPSEPKPTHPIIAGTTGAIPASPPTMTARG